MTKDDASVAGPTPIRLAPDSLVMLAGPSGSGKSTWAKRWFRDGQIVSSDHLRGVVGEHPADMRASGDAFAVMDQIVARRLKRGLLTIVDTLGMTEGHTHVGAGPGARPSDLPGEVRR